MITEEQERLIKAIVDRQARSNFSYFNPEQRYIIMVDNKPVEMRSGFHWSLSWAKTMARRIAYPMRAGSWSTVALQIGAEPTKELAHKIAQIRNEWLDKHVNVVPLMTYIKSRAKMTK